jgi:hypothetical protein
VSGNAAKPEKVYKHVIRSESLSVRHEEAVVDADSEQHQGDSAPHKAKCGRASEADEELQRTQHEGWEDAREVVEGVFKINCRR